MFYQVPSEHTFPRKGGSPTAQLTIGGWLAGFIDEVEKRRAMSLIAEAGLTNGDGLEDLIRSGFGVLSSSKIVSSINHYAEEASTYEPVDQ